MNGSIKCPKCESVIELRASVLPSMQQEVTKTGDIQFLLDKVHYSKSKLNAWEEDFITQLSDRYDKYGDRVKLSDKQREILEGIANKGEK